MNETWENGKIPSSRTNFGPLGPNLGYQILSVTRCDDQLSSSTTSEKNNDSILRKHSDIRTDGKMDDCDFIRCYLTNAQHPKFCPIVTELLLRGRKLSPLLDVISQWYVKMSKIIRLNAIHYFFKKIPNKTELQRIASNHFTGERTIFEYLPLGSNLNKKQYQE